MNIITAFGIEFVLTGLIGALLLSYLRRPLHRVLVDLCGGEDRARFWSAFSTVLLIGVPIATTLAYRPMPGDFADAFFDLASQLGHNVISLLGALVVLGVVVSIFALVAPRTPRERQS